MKLEIDLKTNFTTNKIDVDNRYLIKVECCFHGAPGVEIFQAKTLEEAYEKVVNIRAGKGFRNPARINAIKVYSLNLDDVTWLIKGEDKKRYEH